MEEKTKNEIQTPSIYLEAEIEYSDENRKEYIYKMWVCKLE